MYTICRMNAMEAISGIQSVRHNSPEAYGCLRTPTNHQSMTINFMTTMHSINHEYFNGPNEMSQTTRSQHCLCYHIQH